MTESTDRIPRVVQYADDAYESIRAINHLNLHPTPAPEVYQVLGNLKLVGWMLSEALAHLSDGLTASLTTFDVREDDGGDPRVRAEESAGHMERAAKLAKELGAELELAQSAIARQSAKPIAAN